MKYVSIAAIRKAAHVLKSKKQHVTLESLAAELHEDASVLKPYLKRAQGLSEEIGYVKRRNTESDAYLSVARLLQERGVIVTADRIAALRGAKPNTVRMWYWRHRERIDQSGIVIVDRCALRKMHLLTRVQWIRTLEPRISITKLALRVGRERAMLSRFLRERTTA